MKIALIGAPGSGKTNLAQQLTAEIGYPVVDGYVERLEGRSNYSLGYSADVVRNIMVATERLAAVRYAERELEGHICCGTVIESSCYTAMWIAETLETHEVEDRPIQIIRADLTMNFFAMLLADTWDYSRTLYLPLPADTGTEFDRRLDFSIRDALAMMNVDHTPLTEEDRFAQALELIKGDLESENTTDKSDIEPSATS